MENTNHQTHQNQDCLSNKKVAEIQLIYSSNVKPSQRPKVSTSKEAYDLLFRNWNLDKIEFVEQFKVMLLNRSNKVLGIFELSNGSVGGTVADPKLVFVAALKANASSIILAHNHPSGCLKPSQADINLTKKIKEGGKFLDVAVLDHVIVTNEGHYSFADEGLL